jgi:hypothetical protein
MVTRSTLLAYSATAASRSLVEKQSLATACLAAARRSLATVQLRRSSWPAAVHLRGGLDLVIGEPTERVLWLTWPLTAPERAVAGS